MEDNRYKEIIQEIGDRWFSIVDNGIDEHPDPNVVRITDCEWDVYIDVSCFGDKEDAMERAMMLVELLNG